MPTDGVPRRSKPDFIIRWVIKLTLEPQNLGHEVEPSLLNCSRKGKYYQRACKNMGRYLMQG